MGKRIAKIFFWILGLSSLILGLLIGFLYWKQDDIKALVISSLNENLNGEIKVAQAEISLQKFPMAAIELEQVMARGSNGLNDTLFQVESLFLEFRLWDVFGESIPLEALSLENGDLHLIQKAAVNNWSIFKSSEEKGEFSLSIKAINFKDIRLDYRKDEALYVKAYLASAQAAGIFSSANWQLNLNLDAYADAVEYQDRSYLNFPLNLKSTAVLEGAENILLRLTDLEIDEQSGFSGAYSSEGEGSFSLKHPQLDLEKSLALYRELSYHFPEDLVLKGKVSSELKLLPQANGDLRIEVLAQSEALSLAYADWPKQELRAKLEYYRQGHYDRIEIRELKDQEKELQLVGTIRQIERPNLDLDLAFDKGADFWQSFLQRNFKFRAGRLSGQLKLKGQFDTWSEILSERLNSANFNGDLNLNEIDLSLPDQSEFDDITGKLRFRNRSIFVDALALKRGQSDLALEGEIRDLWSYLFSRQGLLEMRANLRSQNLVLEDFLSQESAAEDSSGLLAWKDRLRLGLNADILNFSFRKFNAKQLKGEVSIDKSQIAGKRISLLADQGSYRGNFQILEAATGLSFEGFLEAQQVDVHSVFSSFDNFSQQTITADNLAGKLSVKANIGAPLSKDLRLDANKLMVQSEMVIEEGHLKNYQPMQALSRFAEVEELNDVSFQTLKNTISIAEGQIQIPEMAIASNVINLNLSGSHSFQNEINYLVKLRLGDVLFSKNDRKAGNEEFEEHLSIAKRDDDHRIPVSIKGTVDDPQISIDARALGDALEDDLKNQKDELKKVFKKEEPKKKEGTGMTFEWDDGAPAP